MCDRWLERGVGFWNFVDDIGDKPDNPEWWSGKRSYYSLDRIDVNGDYTPENCRWATAHVQATNTQQSSGTPNIWWDNSYNGWCASYGINGRTIRKHSKNKDKILKFMKEMEYKYGL